MEDLKKDDLLNLGEWIKEPTTFPHVNIGDHRLHNRSEVNANEFVIFDNDGNEVIPPFTSTTKEHLSKMCYPFLGKDLDFSPKKTYQWADCYKGGFYVDTNSEVWDSRSTSDGNSPIDDKNVCRTKEQALSIAAFSQLTQIIAEINEDFSSDDEYTYFPMLDLNDKIKCQYIRCECKYNNIGCDSSRGFNKLIETNLPLLNQFFNVKTAAE